MSDLRLQVGGRYYTVACTDGEEDHVRSLAKAVDDKLSAMGSNLSGNEAKNLLFAALLLADEVEEARRNAAQPAAPPVDTGNLAGRLERIAGALENAASTLESVDPAS